MGQEFALLKLHNAREKLSVNEGRIRERLANAWKDELIQIVPDRDIPYSHLCEEFKIYRAQLLALKMPTRSESIDVYFKNLPPRSDMDELRQVFYFLHMLEELAGLR